MAHPKATFQRSCIRIRVPLLVKPTYMCRLCHFLLGCVSVELRTNSAGMYEATESTCTHNVNHASAEHISSIRQVLNTQRQSHKCQTHNGDHTSAHLWRGHKVTWSTGHVSKGADSARERVKNSVRLRNDQGRKRQTEIFTLKKGCGWKQYKCTG